MEFEKNTEWFCVLLRSKFKQPTDPFFKNGRHVRNGNLRKIYCYNCFVFDTKKG